MNCFLCYSLGMYYFSCNFPLHDLFCTSTNGPSLINNITRSPGPVVVFRVEQISMLLTVNDIFHVFDCRILM